MTIDYDKFTEPELTSGIIEAIEALSGTACHACSGKGCMDCFETGSEAERQFGE